MVRQATILLMAFLLFGRSIGASEIQQFQRAGSFVRFNLACEPDTQYAVQRSTNFLDWETLVRSYGPAPNRAFEIFSPDIPPLPQAFYRAMQTGDFYGIRSEEHTSELQ